MLTLKVEGSGFDALKGIANNTPKNVRKATVKVANATAKAHTKEIGKEIRKLIVISAKGAVEMIRVKKATTATPSATLSINKSDRPNLKRFSARQTRAGVTYRINKKGKRKLVPQAFGPNISRLGKKVFRRKLKNSGDPDAGRVPRLPLVEVRGVSVAVVYVNNNLIFVSEDLIDSRMEKEMAREIRNSIVREIRKHGRKAGLTKEQINARIARI